MKFNKYNLDTKAILKSLLTLIIGVISLPVFSATYYSRSNGSWHNLNTWSLAINGAAAGAIPGVGDDVVIDGKVVTLSAGNITVASVTMESVGQVWGVTTAKLVISSGKKLTVTGNVNFTSVNKTVKQGLLLKDNNSELEISGNLNFSRTANNAHEYRNELKMEDASILTVHGSFNVNNAGSHWSLSQSDIYIIDNANFTCKANVNITQNDAGLHRVLIDDHANWQIDGNLTINQNGDDLLTLSTSDYGTVTVNQNLTANTSGLGILRFYFGGHNTVGPGALFHVLGDFDILHPSGASVRLRAQKKGELRVDGDFDFSWTGSGSANSTLEIDVYDNAKITFRKSMTINMTDPTGGIKIYLKGLGELKVGANNGMLAESATINLNGGQSMIMDLDSDSKFIIYGDLNQTCNGEGDLLIRLNEGVNTATGSSFLNIHKNWFVNKINGEDFLLSMKNNSNILVNNNLTITCSGFNAGAAIGNKILLLNDSKFEVLDYFNWTTNNPAKQVPMEVKIYQRSILNTGTQLIEATSLNATNAKNIFCRVYHNAQWNMAGDFNFNCLSVSPEASYFELWKSAHVFIGRNLIINNTSNTSTAAFKVFELSLLTVKNDVDFTNVFSEHGGVINIEGQGRMKFGGNIIRRPIPDLYGFIEVEHGDGAILELNGTDPQIIPRATNMTLFGHRHYGVLLLNNTSNVTPQFTIEGKAKITEIFVSPNNTLTIEPGVTMQVSKRIVNNGQITINPGGSIEQHQPGPNLNSGNGVYHVQQTGKNSAIKYNAWSSPVSSANITSVFNNSNPCDIFTFQGATQSWKYDYSAGFNTVCNGNAVQFLQAHVIAGGDGVMDIGRGYFAPGDVNATRTFSGTINNGDYTFPIVTTVLGNNQNWNNDDWNLVGNPYPSTINTGGFWRENAIHNNRISDGIYYWDDSDPAGGANAVSDYAYWNMAGGVNSGNSLKTPNNRIAVGQGFWVIASATTNLVFNNSMRSTPGNQFFKTEPIEENHNAWLGVSSPSNIENNILVGFNPNATDGIDQHYDAHKLEGNTHLNLSSVIDNQEFVIQSQSMMNIGETRIIPLVLFTDESGSHVFKEYKREDLSANIKIYLRDKTNGITHDLSQSNYSVALQANVTYRNRFELVINFEVTATSGNSPKGTTTAVEEIIEEDFMVFQQNGNLIISNQNGKTGMVQVFDMTGKLLLKNKIGVSDLTLNSWSNLSSGSYLITITNNGERLFVTNKMKL